MTISRPSGLLVSVRSAREARAAVAGGASVIDVKEPDHGPLGRADSKIWRAVREVVPPSIPISVALGELCDWRGRADDYGGISYRKIGLAGAGPDWRAAWAEVRRVEGGDAGWVAVAYADWQRAQAPSPALVLETALTIPECSGILLDTWDKTKPSPLGVTPEWSDWVDRARQSGRFVALAGRLDLASIVQLGPLRPDLFAVRGAACDQSDRRRGIQADRVAELARASRLSLL
jgi:(5-formylfuran-3-yl)methyl phosphate synthase